MGKRQ